MLGRSAFLFLDLANLSLSEVGAVQVRNKVNPIRRVVTLLQEMAKKITEEGEQKALWKAIQDRLQPRYDTRVELRADILRQTLSLPLEEIRRAICSWPHRLTLCRNAGGGHFEG